MGLEKYSKSGFVQMSSMRDVAHLNGRSGSIRPAGGREAPVGSCQRRSDRQGVPGARFARAPSLPAGRPLLSRPESTQPCIRFFQRSRVAKVGVRFSVDVKASQRSWKALV
jgi:hypothetical protein